MMINGLAHGGSRGTTVCQLHMRHFTDGDTIIIEPWRARAFPVLKDLVTDRRAFDRIIQAGGFVSVNTGGTPDANALPIGKEDADHAMDAAACIGCGACVAACKKCHPQCCLSRPKFRISPHCRRENQNANGASSTWSKRWTKRGLEIAP